MSYKIEVGYVPNQFNLQQAYLLFGNIGYVGSLQVGQFQPPMGLEVVTSSWDIPLMEPAAPLQAIAPGISAGVQAGKPFDGEEGRPISSVSSARAPVPASTATPRSAMASPWAGSRACPSTIPGGNPSSTRLLHLGLSINVQYSASSSVRYRSRPESYIAPYVIDTGDIDASGSGTLGAEVSWVDGPVNLQAEYLHSWVGESGGDLLNFGGFYVSASWFLTGETRPYDRKSGAFSRVVPRKNFEFANAGWGAFEVAVRYSYTNLTDGNVQGGRLGMLMTGVNWYPRPQVKWMLITASAGFTGARWTAT